MPYIYCPDETQNIVDNNSQFGCYDESTTDFYSNGSPVRIPRWEVVESVPDATDNAHDITQLLNDAIYPVFNDAERGLMLLSITTFLVVCSVMKEINKSISD